LAIALTQPERISSDSGPARKSRSPGREFWRRFFRSPRIWFGLAVALTLVTASVLAPWLATTDPEDMDIALRLAPPSASDWLGRDLNGGSVLTAMLYGGRTSLYISFITVLLSVTLGAGIGLIAGYKRGIVDSLLMRTVDLLMAFPGILLAMALAAFMGPSLNNVIFAIAATGWTSSARLVRGQTLSVREREYVAATKALGAGDLRIIFKHVFPATLSPLVVQATFSLSGVIVTESSLSFLGLGAEDGAPSWGSMLSQGRTVLTEAPWLSIFPGLAIMLMVIALNFIGDALRDILDPKSIQK
jgi:peptide/nickel transport system permease protein